MARDIPAGKAYVELTVKNSAMLRGLADAKKRLNSFAQSATMIGGAMMAGGAAIAAPLGLSLKTFADFQDQMAAVGAVSGATDEQLIALTEQAKELGRTTSFTASQIASLQTELGRAGFRPDEILDATEAIQNLGRATSTDLAKAAEIAGAALRQFSLPTSDATRVADVLTAAANNSATTVLELGEAFSYVGPVATDAGMSIEDTAKALGVLANLGLKGSMGGTGLRRAVLAFANPKVQEQLKGLGVEALTAEGNLRPIADVMLDLGKATKDMPNAARLALFQDMFDLRGMTAGMKLSSSIEEMERMSAAIDNSGGAAAETAKKMDNTLGGTFRRIMSAVEGVQISIGEALAPAFRLIEEHVTSALGWMTAFVEKNQYAVIVIGQVGAALLVAGAALLVVGTMAKIAAVGIGLISTMLAILPAVPALIGIGLAIALAKDELLEFGAYLGGEFMELFTRLGEIGGTAWEGIKAALVGGDWASAAEIAMLGVEAVMAESMVTITKMWEDLKYALAETIVGGAVLGFEQIQEFAGAGFLPPKLAKLLGKGAGGTKQVAMQGLKLQRKDGSQAVTEAEQAAQAARDRLANRSAAEVDKLSELNETIEELTPDEFATTAWGQALAKQAQPEFSESTMGAFGDASGSTLFDLDEQARAAATGLGGGGASGTFSATAAQFMGLGSGSPMDRVARASDKTAKGIEKLIVKTEEGNELLATMGVFAE
jgi:TP901 family phage tail tape measure protein